MAASSPVEHGDDIVDDAGRSVLDVDVHRAGVALEGGEDVLETRDAKARMPLGVEADAAVDDGSPDLLVAELRDGPLTFVVRSSVASWITHHVPSADMTTSNSMPSTGSSAAAWIASRVFSG